MDTASLKRLITLVVASALNLCAKKFGLDASAVAGVNMLVAVFLAQSGIKAGLAHFAASKAGQVAGKALAEIEDVKAAVAQAGEEK